MRFRSTMLDCGGAGTEATVSMSNTSPVAAVEAVDQASETLDPATEALEEQGESRQLLPRTLVLPLTERLFVGAENLKNSIDNRKKNRVPDFGTQR